MRVMYHHTGSVTGVPDRKASLDAKHLDERTHAADSLLVDLVNEGALAEDSFALGVFLGQDMAQVFPTALDLARPCGRKTLGSAPSGFDLGHLILLISLRLKAKELLVCTGKIPQNGKFCS